MTGLFDPTLYWIPLGLLAFLFALVNLVLGVLGKKKGWQILLFLSLACALFTMLAEYQMIHQWVLHEDWAALMDVVPGAAGLLTTCVFIGVLINLIALILHIRNKK